ncbi:hypothetical protein C8Q73DRAFT_666708 [Cubamyces lactineus]|nr:hypothetical protein C8Q73DRAFT_666708 [Cubamyces lactineus]
MTACVAVEFTNVRHRWSLSSEGVKHLIRTSLSERPRHYPLFSVQTIFVQLFGQRCEVSYHDMMLSDTAAFPFSSPRLRSSLRRDTGAVLEVSAPSGFARVSSTIVWLSKFDVDAIISMDVRPTQLSEKELPPPLLPPRPPLITPSLSPPSSRIQRIPDRPAPPKQPRLSSTPSRASSSRLPSTQPGELRLEASTRLFAFWDQLAERYNKPLDEDDIVDLRDLNFLKDRGVTRSATQSYKIGCFGTQDARDDGSSQAEEDDVENVLEEEEDAAPDDSADELDLIGPLQRYKRWYVPPVNEQDPEDAEAFREFEEAERRRRELYGEDEEDDQVVDDTASRSDEAAGVEELDEVEGQAAYIIASVHR